MTDRPLEILLVEDDPGSARLTQEGLKEAGVRHRLTVAADGVEAMAILSREGEHGDASVPDLILLDLNLPRKDGREVLSEIEADPRLRPIPVVVLTTSSLEADIIEALDHNTRLYITKPVDLDRFLAVVESIKDFLLAIGKLPAPEME